MALNGLGLGFMFTATDLASATMGKVRGNFEGLEEAAGRSISGIDRRLQVMGGGLAIAAAGAVGLASAFSLGGAADDFELAVASVGAVSNATTEELKQLSDAAIQAGINTQFSPTEATEGLNELAQAGFNAQESIDLLGPALDLAAGSLGQLSPAQAAGVAAQALKAFGIETRLAGRAVDQMLQASNAFAMRADDLPLALGISARGAAALNQSLTETVIAVGLVKNVIPGTERAATSVAVAMEKMVKPDVQRKLRQIGVEVVDAEGNFREFLDIVGEMAPALDKMTIADRGKFLEDAFGAESLAGLGAILGQITTGIRTNTGETVKGGDALAYLRQQFRGANGVAAEFSARLLDTSAGQKKLLRGSLETLAIVSGKSFSDALRPVVEMTIKAVNVVIMALQTMSPRFKSFGVMGFLAASVLALVVGGLITLGAAWPLLIAGLGLASTAFGVLAASTWAALAPMLPFLAAALLIGGTLYIFTDNIQLAAAGVAAFGTMWAAHKIMTNLAALPAMLAQAGAAFRAFGVAMMANPIGLIVGLFGAMVLAIAAIRNNWFGLRDAFVTGVDVIVDKLGFLKVPLEAFRDFIAGEGAAESVAAESAGTATSSVEQDLAGIAAAGADALGPELVPNPSLLPPELSGGSSPAVPGAPASGEQEAIGARTIEARRRSIASPQGAEIDYKRLGAEVGAAIEKRPLHAVLEVDGEAIATASARADRDSRARAGHPVAEE